MYRIPGLSPQEETRPSFSIEGPPSPRPIHTAPARDSRAPRRQTHIPAVQRGLPRGRMTPDYMTRHGHTQSSHHLPLGPERKGRSLPRMRHLRTPPHPEVTIESAESVLLSSLWFPVLQLSWAFLYRPVCRFSPVPEPWRPPMRSTSSRRSSPRPGPSPSAMRKVRSRVCGPGTRLGRRAQSVWGRGALYTNLYTLLLLITGWGRGELGICFPLIDSSIAGHTI